MSKPSQWTCRCVSVWLVAMVLGGGIAPAAAGSLSEYVAAREKTAKDHPQDFAVSLSLAEIYIYADRFDDAEREFKRAETLPTKADDHSRVHYFRAEMLLRQNKMDEAIAEYRTAADSARFSDDVWSALQSLAPVLLFHRYPGDYGNVCKEMVDLGSLWPAQWSKPMLMLAEERIPAGGPPLLDWEVVAALCACDEKTQARAPALAEAVEAVAPDSPAAAAAATALCGYYMKAATLPPRTSPTFGGALNPGEQVDPAKLPLAARAGERAVKLAPDHWMGHYLLAECYDRQQKLDDAIKQYQEMERTAGHLLDIAGMATRGVSSMYERAGKLDLAFDEYQKTIYGGFRAGRLAGLAIRLGKEREAMAFLQKNRQGLLLVMGERWGPGAIGYGVAALCAAVGDRDGMAANLTLFAQMITGQGSWECQLAEEAAKAPDPAGRDIFLALFGELEGHFPPDRIRAYAEEAIKVDPDLPSANFLLANLLADTDPARAKVLAARALEKAPAGSVLSKIPRYLLDKLEGKPAAGG